MLNISRSQYPIAKKWQCFGCCLIISLLVYLPNFMLASTVAFSGNGGAIGIWCYVIDILYLFVAMITYGMFIAPKGCKFIEGVVIGAVGFANVLTLMILIIRSKNNDCEDRFDWPLYGSIPTAVLILIFGWAMIFPSLYFTAMILSHVPSWDPKKVPGIGEEIAENAAVVIEVNGQLPNMNLNAGQNYPYANPNPANPQPQMYFSQAPQMVVMEPLPMDPNAGMQMGVAPDTQNTVQPNSQVSYNSGIAAMYTPSGPDTTVKENIERAQAV